LPMEWSACALRRPRREPRRRRSDRRRRLGRSFRPRRADRGPPCSEDAKDLEAIRNSLFFNSADYLETNPDVRAAVMDAAFHYLVHGGREGRDPGPFFSTKAYLTRYPDVSEAGLNALLHYEPRGRRENRIAAA
jgi:O-antigen biosynthesis protein